MKKTIGEQLDELDSRLADDEISVKEHAELRADLLASIDKKLPKWPFVAAGVVAAVGLVAAGAGVATVMQRPAPDTQVVAAPVEGEVVEGEAVGGETVGEVTREEPAAAVAMALGDEMVGEYVTVTATETKAFSFEYYEPAQGVLVKTCANSDALSDGDQIGWAPWSLRDSDDGVYAAGDSFWWGEETPKPTYPDGRSLRNSECVKGWVLFDTGGMEVSEVVYENAFGESARWSLE